MSILESLPVEPSGPMTLWHADLGQITYDDAEHLQERLVELRRTGSIPDVLLLLEHPPTITLGRAARREHILLAPEELHRRGTLLRGAARGGDVTFHGPGQRVGYLILDLREWDRDVRGHLRRIEQALISALGRLGVQGTAREGRTGVWVADRKIAAIGAGVRSWVTWHGFAVNIASDLSGFDAIVPCGISDAGITSLSRELGRELPLHVADDAILTAMAECFQRTLTRVRMVELLESREREIG